MGQNYALVTDINHLLILSDEEIMQKLRDGFQRLTAERLSPEEDSAWREALPHLRQAFTLLPRELLVVLEYCLPMSSERIDVVLLGLSPEKKPKAVVLELKGWKQASTFGKDLVLTDGEKRQHPELQLLNYVAKLTYSHSAADRFDFVGCVWLYNTPKPSAPEALSFQKVRTFWKGQAEMLGEFLCSHIKVPVDQNEARWFLQGYYQQTPRLLEAIRNNFEPLRQGALSALCDCGFGLSEEQLQLLSEVLEATIERKRVCFLVQGQPGSGKSYLAVLMLLKSLSDVPPKQLQTQNVAVLGYRNNRLINTVRKVFKDCEPGLDAAVKFYSTGYGKGLAEGDSQKPHFLLAIYDEAQRMTKDNISTAMQRADVTVFFYDEQQILNAEEGGLTENFREAAKNLKLDVRERTLRGIYRVQGGTAYHKFVEELLDNPSQAKLPSDLKYDFRVFTDIREMLRALRQKAEQPQTRVALVAAFTESPGDRQKPMAQSLKNRRIGHPLYSGFDRYKGMDVNIYWLMHERDQYPDFWYGNLSNELTHCASIYGCQGFEANYVGVVWGRDFVLRDNRWELGQNCEDSIGRPSLKELFESGHSGAHDQALRLLVNRYRIFLTRGIHGTYVYCEDDETAKFLYSVM